MHACHANEGTPAPGTSAKQHRDQGLDRAPGKPVGVGMGVGMHPTVPAPISFMITKFSPVLPWGLRAAEGGAGAGAGGRPALGEAGRPDSRQRGPGRASSTASEVQPALSSRHSSARPRSGLLPRELGFFQAQAVLPKQPHHRLGPEFLGQQGPCLHGADRGQLPGPASPLPPSPGRLLSRELGAAGALVPSPGHMFSANAREGPRPPSRRSVPKRWQELV